MACPLPDIRWCPLYHAAHDGTLAPLGCMDGRLEEGAGCAVGRGQEYAPSVAALRIARSGFVEQIEWDADLARLASAPNSDERKGCQLRRVQ